MTAAVSIGAASAPRLAAQVKLRFDEARQRWTLLAPERVLVPDEIAVEILKLCDGVATVDAIADTLAARFEAPRDEVARDVVEMLQELANKGMVVA